MRQDYRVGCCAFFAALAIFTVSSSSQANEGFDTFSISPYFAFGYGAERRIIGDTTNPANYETSTVKLSAGGGYGGGLALRLGIMDRLAIETVFGTQVTKEDPKVSGASGEFERDFGRLSLLTQFPVGFDSRVITGVGVGSYRGGALNVHHGGALNVDGFVDIEADYQDALGQHLVIAWETEGRYFYSGGIKLTLYAVEYDADQIRYQGTVVNDIIGPEGKSLRQVDGSGADIAIYFSF